MGCYREKAVFGFAVVVLVFWGSGCKTPADTKVVSKVELGPTIGSMVEIFALDSIVVEGYSLVGGLRGNGSQKCPPGVKKYLIQYILKQSGDAKVNANKLINSLDTAAVVVRGTIPGIASRGQRFDVRVEAVADTGTTSLEGGHLYTAELAYSGESARTRTLAKAVGPVYVDKIVGGDGKRRGYVLGGGEVLDDYKIRLSLREPDYVTSSAIRNRLNERFVGEPARALSQSQIELAIPARYRRQKRRFVSLAAAMYLGETSEATRARIERLGEELASGVNKEQSEIGLEAIGKASLGQLGALLESGNEDVRLRAARCMLNLGNDQGLHVLRQIAMQKGSSRRIEALDAIAAGANYSDAGAIGRRLLRDADFPIRLAAYEHLRKLDDIAIKQTVVEKKFYIEHVAQTPHKAIYVSRSGRGHIVLFGTPIKCREDVFVQSADGNVTVNGRAGQGYVSVIRRLEDRPDIGPIELKSSYDLSDIILAMCQPAVVQEGSRLRSGLNVSYAEAIYILKQMSEKGMVDAVFYAGPLPEIGF